MPIFDIRIKHPHHGDGQELSDYIGYHHQIIEFVDDTFSPTVLVSGLEQLNHFKDLIPFHTHLRMDCSTKSDKTVRDNIRQFVEETLGNKLGNGDFKVGKEGATKNALKEPERFWRYLWKECRIKHLEKSPYDFQRTNELEMMAKDEFHQLAIYNCAKREKDSNHRSLLERIIESIQSPLKSEDEVIAYVHDYIIRLRQPYRDSDIVSYIKAICFKYDLFDRAEQLKILKAKLHN